MSDFSRHSAVVLQWLAIGVYLNSYAQVPFAFIQGIGRADITAKFHLLELPVYAVLLFVLLHTHGIVGAAVAWNIRVAFDALLLSFAAFQLEQGILLKPTIRFFQY